MTERDLFIQLCIANTETSDFDHLQRAAALILKQADKRYPAGEPKSVSDSPFIKSRVC